MARAAAQEELAAQAGQAESVARAEQGAEGVVQFLDNRPSPKENHCGQLPYLQFCLSYIAMLLGLPNRAGYFC